MEAPIVIYSMTTSTHAGAPQGIQFKASHNHLAITISSAVEMMIYATPNGQPNTEEHDALIRESVRCNRRATLSKTGCAR
jgi:hypothetical protein